MDSSFVFPKPQPPALRPKQMHRLNSPSSNTTSRESNALRASVLDAALELGIGTNPLVANWMFSDPLTEEDEGEDQFPTPGLTYSTSATSEESSFSALTPSSPTHSSSSSKLPQPISLRPGGVNGILRGIEEENKTNSGGNGSITFPIPPVSQKPIVSRKLKKKKNDGYESDGGYMSESGHKKKDKKKSGDGAETEKEAKKRAKQEKKEFQEEERQRKKSLLSAAKAAKKAASKDKEDEGNEYDTDGGGLSKTFGLGKSKTKKTKKDSSSDVGPGYETDGGYQSSGPIGSTKKPKTRFFKLSTKGGRPDLSAVLRPANNSSGGIIPAVPTIPKDTVSLPIAERFATTLNQSISSTDSPTMPSSIRSSSIDDKVALSPNSPFSTSSGNNFDSHSQMTLPTTMSPIPFPSSESKEVGTSLDPSSSISDSKRHGSSFSPSSLTPLVRRDLDLRHKHGSDEGSQPLPSASGLKPPMFSAYGRSNSPSIPASRSVSPIPSPLLPLSSSSSPSQVHANLLPYNALQTSSINFTSTSPLLQVSKTKRVQPSSENINRSVSRNGNGSPISPISPYTGNGSLVSPPLRSQTSSPALGVTYSSTQSQTLLALGSLDNMTSSSSVLSSSQNRQYYRPIPANDAEEPSSLLTVVPPSPTPSDIGDFNDRSSRFSGLPPSPRFSGLPPSPRISGFPLNPRLSGLPPSPNVLAYYDLPPPSPPPQGPLPNVPHSVSRPVSPRPPVSPNGTSIKTNFASGHEAKGFINNPNQFPSPALLRQRVIDRTPRALPVDFSTIQRGKESPFPSRPVLSNMPPLGPVPTVRRYQDLYGQEIPTSARSFNKEIIQATVENSKATKMIRFREAPSWIPGSEKYPIGDAYGGYQYNEDEHELGESEEDDDNGSGEEIMDVLNRYVDARSTSLEEPAGRALQRSHSSEALQQENAGPGSDPVFEYSPPRPKIVPPSVSVPVSSTNSIMPATANRESEYFDDYEDRDDVTVGNRESRWSGSIYSRASILDADSSGRTREQLLRQVEVMLEKKEGSMVSAGNDEDSIPPVPRIPDVYANMNPINSGHINAGIITAEATPGGSWNRF